MRHPLAAALLLATLAPAAAQDRPPLHPSRDVSVTYRVEGGAPGPGAANSGPMEMRLSWNNAEQKMRMDMPGGQGWSVTDMRTGGIFIVQDAARMAMQMPPDPSRPNPAQPGPDMRFTRGGSDTVLGHRCTTWTIRGPEGEGEACITAEGVMLRSRGAAMGASGSMVATQVAFGAQDPARFQVPQGYQTMQMPGMPGAPAAPGRPPAR